MRHEWISLHLIGVMFGLLSTVAAASDDCEALAPINTCQGRVTCPLGICVPCGCSGQLLCPDVPPCDLGHRVGSLPVIPFQLCEYAGYSAEPTTNSTVIVPEQAIDEPLWGWADVHEHQFANLAYGGTMFWGSVFDARGVNAALAWCDYTWDYEVWSPNYGAPDLGLPDPSFPVLPFWSWGYPIHGSMFASPMPPFIPTQEIYGFTNNMATHSDPFAFHLPGGNGPFDGWPSYLNGGHQQMYHKWLERAYEGGMRLLVNLPVENEVLCELSYRRAGYVCNDMISAERQIYAIYALEDFIDAECGEPGCGWYRVATSPQEAREIISSGKLAVIIGIEVDSLFNCKPNADFCTPEYIRERLDYYYNLGVRYIFPVHLFDNKFAGAALYGDIFTYANFFATGEAIETWDCWNNGYEFKVNPFDLSNPLGLLYAALATIWGEPVFDQTQWAHCNAKGLTPDGEFLIEELIERNMIIDIDHLSYRALEGYPNDQEEYVRGAFDIFEDEDGARGYTYPIVSGHPVVTVDYNPHTEKRIGTEYGHTITRVKRIRDLGGVVAVNLPRGKCGTTREFLQGEGVVKGYLDIVDIMDGDADVPFYGEGHPAIGLIADMGCFIEQVGPRFGPDAEGCPYYDPYARRLKYPFEAFDGSGEFCQQQTGDQIFDFNEDGLAHIGLMPDLLADVRNYSEDRSGPAVDLDPMFNSAETFIRMWERIEYCTPDEDPPTVTCPPTISVSASPEGTEVFYDMPTATDDCDAAPVVSTDIPSGSIFGIGVTTVTATATDASGNVGTCTFDVAVSCFGVHHLKIGVKRGHKNKLQLKGVFRPAVAFDPVTADVSYWIDDGNGNVFDFFVPAGSFEIEGDPAEQVFIFDSLPGDVPDIMAKFNLLERTFQLHVKDVSGAGDIVGTTLTAGLRITDGPIPCVGEETVETTEKPNFLEYNAHHKPRCDPPKEDRRSSQRRLGRAGG